MTRLRQKFIEDLEVRNYAASTIRAYVRHVAALAQYFSQSPGRLGRQQIHHYQLYLVRECKLATPSLSQIVSGLRFFYETTLGRPWVSERIPYPRHERHLPTVLSRAEVTVTASWPTASGANSWLRPASCWLCPSLSPRTNRPAQTARNNTAVRSAAKDACCWSRRSKRRSPRPFSSLTARNAMNAKAQRPAAQHSLDAGLLELRPAPAAFFPVFPPLLGSRAPSTLLQPPPTELPEPLRRPARVGLRPPKNIQIPSARPRG